MKKQNHRQAVRRKKTQADRKVARRRAVHKSYEKHKSIERTKTLRWEDLNNLHGMCAQMLLTARPVTQLLNNRDMLQKMGDSVSKLQSSADMLINDITKYNQRLKDIKAKHEGYTGEVNDPDSWMRALQIGEEYNQWQSSFQDVVLPNISTLTELYNSALPKEHQLEIVNTPIEGDERDRTDA